MGFREEVAVGAIAARFTSVSVYEVQGVVMPPAFSEALPAQVAGVEYRIALAQSVNEGCRTLIGDDFTESEQIWREEVKTKGPFALVAVGPTELLECTAKRVSRDAVGNLTTYDAFPSLRGALRGLEQRVLPPVFSALTFALSVAERPVYLRWLACAWAGRCSDGAQVHDVSFEMNAEMHVSRVVDRDWLVEAIGKTVVSAPKLNQRAAKFFALGERERDHLKRFIYFFIAIEVQTHAAFTRLNHEEHVASMLSRSDRRNPDIINLIQNKIEKSSNLFDRFVWCAACAWPDVVEADIALFRKLKVARDDIAHGRVSELPRGFSREARMLAHKVIWR